MKKRLGTLAAAALLSLATSIFAAASSTFFDDCVSAENTEFITYQNWSITNPDFGEEVGWPDTPDKTVLTADFTGGTPSAVYHISGVDRLTVSFYTPTCPLAVKNEDGNYVLASSASDEEGHIDLDGTLPVSYSPVDGNLYLNTPDQGYLLYMAVDGAGVFCPLPDEDAFLSQIKDTLTNSFLEVLVSDDDESYHPIDYDFTFCQMSLKAESALTYYYCTLYLPIPSGTRYIGLQMNYTEEIPTGDGGSIANRHRNRLRLARVDFEGEYLNWGDPLPEEEEGKDPIYNVEGIYLTNQSSASSRTTSGDRVTQYFTITNNYYNGNGSQSSSSQVLTSGSGENQMKLILSDEAALPAAQAEGEQKSNNFLFILCSIIYLVLASVAVVVLIFKYRSSAS